MENQNIAVLKEQAKALKIKGFALMGEVALIKAIQSATNETSEQVGNDPPISGPEPDPVLLSKNETLDLNEPSKPKTVTFSHRFLFATYNLDGTRVDFVNGQYKTTNPQIIEKLRSHPDMGGELAEVNVNG